MVIGSNTKTGLPILVRKYPTPSIAPGKPAKHAHEYLRPGPRVWRASWVLPTGPVVWHVGQTRPSADVAPHVAHVIQPLPPLHRYDGVVENRTTPWRLDVCRVVAQWCQGSWVAKDLCRGGQRRPF